MNTHDHHHEPLPGEDELKALYRSLPRHEPTPALDEAVRRAAAPLRTSPRRMAHWPVAAASAAVLMLAVGLGWHMRDQVPGMPQTPAVSASTPPPAAPTIQAANDNATRLAVPAAALPSPSAPATITRQAAHESIRAAIRPRVAPPAPSAQQVEAAPSFTPMPAPAETPTTGHRTMTMKAVATPPMPAAPAPMPATDPTAASPTDTPAQELDKIRLLLTQQRRNEALQRLAVFQHAHPDVTLPDDLRAQLPDHD